MSRRDPAQDQDKFIVKFPEKATPQDTPSRRLDQYIARFPDGMRDRLKTEAVRNNRSLNAEIIARLEASFGVTVEDRFAAIESRLAELERR